MSKIKGKFKTAIDGHIVLTPIMSFRNKSHLDNVERQIKTIYSKDSKYLGFIPEVESSLFANGGYSTNEQGYFESTKRF